MSRPIGFCSFGTIPSAACIASSQIACILHMEFAPDLHNAVVDCNPIVYAQLLNDLTVKTLALVSVYS